MSTKTAKGRLKSANTGRIAGAPGARSNPWLLFIVLPRLARHEGLHDTPVLTQQVRQERGKDGSECFVFL